MSWLNRNASYDFMNVCHIHPLKQKQVELLIKEARKFSTLRYIIIFGSSVSDKCTPSSDIDVMTSGLFGTSFIPPMCDEFDILYAEHTSKDNVIWNNILQDGVIVYDSR